MGQCLIDKGKIRILSESPHNLSSMLSSDELDELWNRKNNRFNSTLWLGTDIDPMIRCYYDMNLSSHTIAVLIRLAR